MPPLTQGILLSLGKTINQIPDQTDTFRNQPTSFHKRIFSENTLFRKLVAKLVGEDIEEQIAFLMHQARKMSSTTYIKAALKSIPPPPDYATLQKVQRQNYSHLHQLIDQIIPIAAGSESILSQKMLIENRWTFVHKEPYVPINMSLKSLRKAIEKKFNSKDEMIEYYMSRAQKLSSKYLDIALQTISVPPDYTTLGKKDRRKYSHLHNLVNKVLPLAAGSCSPEVQQKLLERR